LEDGERIGEDFMILFQYVFMADWINTHVYLIVQGKSLWLDLRSMQQDQSLTNDAKV